MEIPRNVRMGPDILEEVAEVCTDLSFRGRALVISGKQTYEVAGRRVEEALENEGYDTRHMLVDQADMRTASRVLEKAKVSGFLLGVGGGTCIDIAKFASFKQGKPFISVPTAASHDGISSSRASIGGSPSIRACSPFAIVADTLIIKNSPPRLTAAGCGDMIANYTAVRDWEIARDEKGEPFSEYAAALSKMSARLVLKNAEEIAKGTEDSARRIVKALISSGVAISIAGSSRPASGSEHKFSHGLDRIAPEPALHGEQCGVGAMMMAKLQSGNWQELRDSLEIVGCPTDAEGLGIAPEHIIDGLTRAHEINPARYTVLGKGLNSTEAERLAKETYVI